ncbi:LysE family translocator [Marinomonas ostreistagni]|uniref:LysE family translocator n=1 Tax=Marinomonas ostreistagni TaxID=359209 RepID=UPI001950BF7E|nr:LysE family transporter [Marinomonas ostreistagni]MBM6550303.1 LysE family transporter [Marinomonas ostreistagni]
MLEIFLFALAMMYSPGPVNMLSLFAGISHYGWRVLRFCAGVGVAMALLFVITGYLGSSLMTPTLQGVAALLGSAYIAYLAVKIFMASFMVRAVSSEQRNLSFVSGFFMQLTNPKAMVAVLPIVTVQFPNADIHGLGILVMSMVLGVMAGGAPTSYFLAGHKLKHAVLNPKVMSMIQRLMAVLLLAVAGQFVFEALRLLG